MKTQLSILFVLMSFFLSAQNKAEYSVITKNDKIYLEATINLNEVQAIVEDVEYCEAGTATSFCLRNYLTEKLSITADGSSPIAFSIEASLSNSTKLQINLSSDETFASVNEIVITNNAFVDEIVDFHNSMKIKLNGTETKVILDTTTRTVTVN